MEHPKGMCSNNTVVFVWDGHEEHRRIYIYLLYIHIRDSDSHVCLFFKQKHILDAFARS